MSDSSPDTQITNSPCPTGGKLLVCAVATLSAFLGFLCANPFDSQADSESRTFAVAAETGNFHTTADAGIIVNPDLEWRQSQRAAVQNSAVLAAAPRERGYEIERFGFAQKKETPAAQSELFSWLPDSIKGENGLLNSLALQADTAVNEVKSLKDGVVSDFDRARLANRLPYGSLPGISPTQASLASIADLNLPDVRDVNLNQLGSLVSGFGSFPSLARSARSALPTWLHRSR